ncbi:MAG: PAS domain S-box protein, partial [Methanolinea sp.]|nr:PAS domain S-box protein [Methanolinea sp.]
MIKGVLVDRSNDPDAIRWCRDDEINISLLPGDADLRETLLRQQFDFCIIHENPGNSDGVEIIRQTRSLDPSIPLIVLTGVLDADLGGMTLDAGADLYLWDITRQNYRNVLVPAIKNLVKRRKIEAQLLKDNILMRTIHDASPIAACVIKDHRIVWMNAIIPRKLGYTEDELIHFDSAGLFPGEEEHRRVDTGLYESSTEGGWGMVEGQLKRKDGTLLSCHLLSRPIDPFDPGKGQIVIGQDITDYVRMRDLLRKSEVRYQDLLDSANSIVLRVDTRGTIRFINQFGAAFFGFTTEELTGKNLIGTIVPPRSSTGR